MSKTDKKLTPADGDAHETASPHAGGEESAAATSAGAAPEAPGNTRVARLAELLKEARNLALLLNRDLPAGQFGRVHTKLDTCIEIVADMPVDA